MPATAKLYETDPYVQTFTATVLVCTPAGEQFAVQLDRTAFYPEGGGQPADTGVLGGAHVLDVQLLPDAIVHYTDVPLTPGAQVRGGIDWPQRFRRMQGHSGEHIISGLIHSEYGFDNVGFHLGEDAITMDYSGELTWQQLMHVERLANEAVYRNVPIRTEYPAPEQLAHMEYRSKLDLKEDVRIVTVEGYDVCATKRDEREGESKFRGIFSKMFFALSNKLTDTKMPYGAMDFRMMKRQVVDSILELAEVQRFSKGIFSWVGFNTKWISFKTVDRQLGQTTWKFSSLFRYAIDGITCFSVAPLRFTAVMGAIIFVISLIYIMITLVQTLFFGITTPGYVTTLCAVLFLGGITEMSIGILGEYIGRIYMETKDRPIYITKFSNFEDENNEEKE